MRYQSPAALRTALEVDCSTRLGSKEPISTVFDDERFSSGCSYALR